MKFRWEVLQHSPYSIDLLPCDFHIFGEVSFPLRRHCEDTVSRRDDEVKDWVRDFLHQQPPESYARGINLLMKRWDLYLNKHGDYF
ncbi:histone-lysine n-methyltransferase setmar-like protein [Lasius niger]|uniref:Histone-lysine n-methyltransferase setmar-like protein n=1 Tax=Lasius niger TaxID=67767 RepID=A0A0J7KPC7_LASNI|nr:histone-lysine n-methyltransferase setmar-like protein [Lasius niger]